MRVSRLRLPCACVPIGITDVSPAQELAPLASEARIGVHAQAEQRGSSRGMPNRPLRVEGGDVLNKMEGAYHSCSLVQLAQPLSDMNVCIRVFEIYHLHASK
jgi:hypothetical protein